MLQPGGHGYAPAPLPAAGGYGQGTGGHAQPVPSGAPVYYMYKGQKFADLAGLQAAVQNGDAVASRKLALKDVLDDESALEEKIKELFRQYAGDDRKLNFSEMQGLAASLGARLGVDQSAFGDIRHIFRTYDFSSDGHLDLEETSKAVKHMLRRYRDSQQPPMALVSLRSFSVDTIPSKKLDAHFELQKKLGQGGQGAVYLAVEKACGQQRVVKFYDKSDTNAPSEDIVDEFKLLKKLDHPKIARIYEVFQDFAYIYVVSEPYFGGDLSTCAEKASENGVKLSQKWLAGILSQMCAGVGYLHRNKSMHCDLKEPNVMISGNDDWQNPNVVVIDFGLARDFRGKSGVMGTPGYMPPEVWQQGLWTARGDVFAMGVMFYRLYCLQQRAPFTGSTIEELQRNTCQMNVDFQPLSNCPPFQRMVQSMLSPDLQQRPTVEQVQKRSWWSEVGQDGSAPMSQEGIANLQHHKRKSELHTALMTDMISHENLAHLRELNDLFTAIDEDNSGAISEAEFRKAMNGQLPPHQVDQLATALMGQNGEVTYSRFMAEMMAAKRAENSQVLWTIFKELDKDGSNTLNREELQAMMSKPKVREILGRRSPDEMLQKMDADGDGVVDFREFKRAMESDDPHPGRRRSSGAQGVYSVGEKVQYYSSSYSQWMDTKITAVDAKSGAIQLECKPGFWMHPPEHQVKVKRAS
eukprot:TRINITY_DN88911_c0_g1_i1.p1 TRINITY_DN88911_c0_g1~~TRINITY_DN88911_c0_g1_i1.p1  ORF type:complete len:694 (-),score=146.52 TRINITY_DN88911_c0_g1_i1:48-2129(-)